ncbi:MAG: Splicing factor [Thelocarpon impressellum]|nr:MAG: Splicing factor [Thelocarpon impressellum]
MDINSLLSPQESPTTEGTPPKGAAGTLRRENSSMASGPTSSPHAQPALPPPSLPRTTAAQAQHAGPSQPHTSPSAGRPPSANSAPSAEGRPGAARQGSTPGMDTLADLASMQHHHQAARVNANGLRSSEVYDSHQIPAVPSYPSVTSLPRTLSTPRSSIDVAMPDAATRTPPSRTYASASLAESDLQTITQLDSYLIQNPYAYTSHVQLIDLLHRGFVSHIQSSPTGLPPPSAHDYELLQDLRQSREAMQARFPVGEALWADWIADESALVVDIDGRVAVMELCRRAVEEEVGSTRLWRLYGDWVSSLHAATHPEAPPSLHSDLGGDGTWTDEEKMVGAELFGWDTVVDVWERAVRSTEWRLHDSHAIWDRYAGIMLEDLAQRPSAQKGGKLKRMFVERLQVPHETWDQTFQTFSTFITNFDAKESYEETMVETNARAAQAKALHGFREVHELKLRQAADANDSDAEWTAMSDYLDWEVAQLGKKMGSLSLCNGLYERATLRFATDARLWEDYVFFVVEKGKADPNMIPLFPVLQRATRHCPWSGTLWSQYLLSLERGEQPFHEIEEVKHRATSTGLMDIGGMEEVLKVHTAWCGYLLRRAFHDSSTDEEADVAEVGIRSALESVKELGEKKHGKDYQGDSTYRLERIYVEYLSHSGLWDRARKEVWRALIPSRGDNWEFWLRWYNWEMICWSRLSASPRTNGAAPGKRPPSASDGTAVLRQALKRRSLDWPEKVLEVYIQHVEDHESVEELQQAVLLCRRITLGVAKRREREAAALAEAAAQQQQQQQQQQPELDQEEVLVGQPEDSGRAKRKRGPDPGAAEGNTSKKPRADEGEYQADHGAPSESSPLKRDRENTTVIVKKLPVSTSEVKVRQFFRDCGTINSLRLTQDEDAASATATIEFDSKEDVLSAQTRDMKSFEGQMIEVQVGTGSTLFVTNFPPTADEAYIRDLFKEYGEIVDVRFPSLKYNTHRRFCYVQFKSSSQASQATQLDGKALDEKTKLVAKISDPGHKQSRTGALYDGRELHVSNVDWSATEGELSRVFSKYGTVESVRIPTNIMGKSKGFAFVVFSSKDEANLALDMNLTKFKSRLLNVSLSTANPAKRQATTIISRARSSASPTPEAAAVNGATSPQADSGSRPSRDEIQARTLALTNIPDTVNDARVRALLEPYGPLTKISLRHDHQGAIVEFADTADAGKAALGVEGVEIAPGRKIGVGTVREMMAHKAEVRSDRIQPGGPKKAAGGLLQQSGPIRRPDQAGARRGGKGGLGLKRGGGGLGGGRARAGESSTVAAEAPADSAASSGAGEGKKSNADFRALFAKPEAKSKPGADAEA